MEPSTCAATEIGVVSAHVREQVRARYADVARLVLGSRDPDRRSKPQGDRDSSFLLETGTAFGSSRYSPDDLDSLPRAAVAASLGCGSPSGSLFLIAGQRVLDLGCGGGIDLILAARQVGPNGLVVGLDVAVEMIELAQGNAEDAAVENVSFLQAAVEELPVADGVMDVVTSNGVINFSINKLHALQEAERVLVPGGSIHFLDVVAEDRLTMADRLQRAADTGCTVGPLSRSEYRSLLARAGFIEPVVEFLQPVVDGMHSTLIRATKRA